MKDTNMTIKHNKNSGVLTFPAQSGSTNNGLSLRRSLAQKNEGNNHYRLCRTRKISANTSKSPVANMIRKNKRSMLLKKRREQLEAQAFIGHIKNLQLGPKFPVTINGRTLFTLQACFSYCDGHLRIIEVSHMPNNKEWEIKKRAIEAYYHAIIKPFSA